jgi:hypothetical protein
MWAWEDIWESQHGRISGRVSMGGYLGESAWEDIWESEEFCTF